MNKKNVKKIISRSFMFLIKPFIVPILIIVILLFLACSITDILYIAFNNDDKINMQKELQYYDAKYEQNEMKKFFSSVWEFIQNIFGGGEMAEDTDWPVKRTLYNNK